MVATSASALAAERARVILEYAREGKAHRVCPDEGTFRALVAARLGYDPFVGAGSLALRVVLVPRRGGLDGRLSLTSAGQPKGTRTLRSAGNDCYELAASLALASAVAVDPEGVVARQDAADGAPPATPAPTPQTPATSAPSASPAAPTNAPRSAATPVTADVPSPKKPPRSPAISSELTPSITLEAGGAIAVGTQPGAAPLFHLGARIGGHGWSIGLEGAASLPTERAAAFGTVSAHVVYGSLVPCGRPGLGARVAVDLCAVASAGALFSDAARVTRSSPATARYATLGPRVGLTWMPWTAVGFSAKVELPVTVSRVHLVIDDAGRRAEAWTSSPVGFVGGIALVWQGR